IKFVSGHNIIYWTSLKASVDIPGRAKSHTCSLITKGTFFKQKHQSRQGWSLDVQIKVCSFK
ncbi:hypothetical protein, partial [Bacillus sp. GbtcB13]|uniref:hypothetical protein n=1 Tax=Bacillus sp. GbtcB13 TaxID=2824758 RepID=UPI001C2F4AA4